MATRRVEATVADATVGRSVTYNVTVTQSFTPVASNVLAGTVTSVGDAAVDVGDELYAVDGVPVRVVEGGTPFWRDLSIGVAGPDVAQLEHALVTLGYLNETADERYTAATSRAVRVWQKAMGHVLTGVVPHGEVVAVPRLPTTVELDEMVAAGLVLTGGEPVVLARQNFPTFALVLMQDQAARVRPDARVTVRFEDRQWSAVVTRTNIDDDGSYHLELASSDGGTVCGEDCALLPAEETITLLAEVELVPSAQGPGVPAAAVRTDTAGHTYVVRPDGTEVPVTVRASGDGIAVIEGIEVGARVVVLDGRQSGADASTVPGSVADDDE